MHKLTKKFPLFILLAGFTLLTFPPHRVFSSCGILGSPDPWFKTQVTFDKNTIPNGIEIQANSTYDPSLINKSLEPFYLVEKNSSNESYPNSELPPNYKPLYKITASQEYFWGRKNIVSNDAEGWNWTGSNIAIYSIHDNQSFHTLEQSKQIFAANRPANVQIPEPQNFKILGFYKGSPVEIRGTIHYSLNDKYDPVMGTGPCGYGGEDIFANSPLGKVIIYILEKVIIYIADALIIIAIIVILWGTTKWIRSKGDKVKAKSARYTLIGGVIGLILVFLAYIIITLVAGLFGI